MYYRLQKIISLIARKSNTHSEQRRAEITTIVLLIVLVLNIISAILIRYAYGQWGVFDLIGLIGTSIALLISRTRYYSIGAFCFIFLSSYMAYHVARLHTSNEDVLSWLIWLALPLLVTPLMLSWRKTILISFVPAAFMLAFIIQEHPAHWGGLMSILIIGAFTSIAIAYSYDNDLRLISLQNKRMLHAYDETLQGWATILEIRDKETKGHSERVSKITLLLAKELGIQDETKLQSIRYGSLLHDIGKIAIPDSVLLKPEILNSNERKVIELHTEYAYQSLKDIEFLQSALDIPRYHHEKWDGSGYTHGLRGTQIPLYARIFAVVDCWDALTNDRPYRQAWTKEQAITYITKNSGIEFDPQIVQAFLKILQQSNTLLPDIESSNTASA